MGSIGTLMQMRNLASEIQYRQAEGERVRAMAATEQAQADQRNKDLADQNYIQSISKDPEAFGKIAGGDMSPLAGNVQDKTIRDVQTKVDAHHKELATNTETDLKNYRSGLTDVADAIRGMRSLGDVGKINQALPTSIGALNSSGALRAARIDPQTAPKSISDLSDLDLWEAKVNAAAVAADKALEIKGEQQKQATAATTQRLQEAEIPGKKAEAKISAAKAQLMQSALAGGATDTSGVDTIIPPDKYPQQNIAARAAYKLGLATGDIAKAQENVMKIYAEQVAPVEKQKAEIPGEISKAVAIEKAKAPIETARALQVAGTNRAMTGAEKLDTEYNTARSTTEALGHILDLADKGNKAAGANVPLVGVETLNAINGIKRVNSMEISQYGSAGSLLDKIKGKLGSITEGKPIPQDVLNDIRELHESLGTQAYEKYTTGLKSLEARTPGAKLAPTIPPPNIRRGSGGAQAPIIQRNKTTGQYRYSTDGGQTWQQGQPK